MQLISYSALGKIRLGDYVTGELSIEESGMIGLVGLGGWESFGETYFSWRQGEDFLTAGISLHLAPDSMMPADSAKRILSDVGLPVSSGMTREELIRLLGAPETVRGCARSGWFLRFVCGDPEQYFISCVVQEEEGLVTVHLARKDYCDENAAI